MGLEGTYSKVGVYVNVGRCILPTQMKELTKYISRHYIECMDVCTFCRFTSFSLNTCVCACVRGCSPELIQMQKLNQQLDIAVASKHEHGQ